MRHLQIPGSNAQPEVRVAILRYFRETLRDRPLLYWLLGDGTPPFKLSKEDSAYTDNSLTPRQTCANCVSLYLHPTSGTYICDQVRGVIQPPGWCNRWRPPMPPETYRAYQERT